MSIAFSQSGCPSVSLNCGTFANVMSIPSASMPSIANTSYTATYTFEAISTITTATDVSPVGYIASGSQVKHTDQSAFSSLPPIDAVSNTLTLGLGTSSSLVNASNRTVTQTATVSNTGSAGSMDDFAVSLPSGAAYVAGSAQFNGSAISDPNISGQTLTWAGVWNVGTASIFIPATSNLSFQVTLPAVNGSYSTSVIGNVGASIIDTTTSTADDVPATTSVTVDTTPPTTTITSQPASLSNSSSASFGFTASETSSFQCQLDSGAWSACTSPQALTGLSDGSHTFAVRATDQAGNQGSAASYTWTIDTTPPTVTITSSPPADSTSTSASSRSQPARPRPTNVSSTAAPGQPAQARRPTAA
jgi:hypothetical protein